MIVKFNKLVTRKLHWLEHFKRQAFILEHKITFNIIYIHHINLKLLLNAH